LRAALAVLIPLTSRPPAASRGRASLTAPEA